MKRDKTVWKEYSKAARLFFESRSGGPVKRELKQISLEKRPKNVQYRHLLKAPDLNAGTQRSEGSGCVSGRDVGGS